MSEEKPIQFLLKELELCYAEISRRSQDQFRSVIAALAAIGTVVGLVSEFTDSLVNLLAAVPWVHAVLGYIWVDNSFAIFRQGEYIRRILEPELRRQAGLPSIGHLKFVGESRIRSRQFGEKPSLISHYFPLIFFIFPSILAMVAFIAYYAINKETPSAFSSLIMAASTVFVVFLFKHWRYASNFIIRMSSEEVEDK
jgi:hypothetical protein